ncbi:hypothetical protein [Selenomonas sp. AE3005]|uniref:hypothetical protein n=1 Tax=Selenomonas sp. AE3005 TaxID=1485543 RepID=UPI0004832EF3|nr:hypothetical protein [Selenomonas sp. AE3005]
MPQLIGALIVIWLICKIVMFIIGVVAAIGPTVLNMVAIIIAGTVFIGAIIGAYFAIANYVASFKDVMHKRNHGGAIDGTNADE